MKKTSKKSTVVAKVAEVKPVIKKAEVKAAEVVKTAEEKATEVKEKAVKATKAVKETTAKKAAGVKATAKKAASKKAITSKVTLEFSGKQYTNDDLVKIAKDVWRYDLKKKVSDFKSVELYVKPEESSCYYIINGEVTGEFYI